MTGIPALRTVRFAAVLCLSATIAQAEEMPRRIPVYSGHDGSSVRVDVSRSGNRMKAVPSLEIPGKSVRKLTAGDGTGDGSPDAPAGVGGEKRKMPTDIGDIIERNKSLLVREGPEGVSLGNAFDLMGDIREALKKKPGNRGRREEASRARKDVSGGTDLPDGSADAAGEPVANLPGDSVRSSSDIVRSGPVIR